MNYHKILHDSHGKPEIDMPKACTAVHPSRVSVIKAPSIIFIPSKCPLVIANVCYWLLKVFDTHLGTE